MSEQQARPARPAGVRFWTVEDVVAWIEANVDYRGQRHKSALDAAIWWHAYGCEEQIRDLTTRERVELLVEGSEPLSADSVTDELQNRHDDTGPDWSYADVDAGIEEELRDFFKK